MGSLPRKTPMRNSQAAEDVLQQAELIFQDVRKSIMQAYNNDKAHYDRKEYDSKVKERAYMHVLQLKAGRRGSNISFTEFRWIGPQVVEKALPNNHYLVRKTGTHKTQILHLKRQRPFTPREPIRDVPTTSQNWKHDPEVIIKHDDLYARGWAWESEFKKHIFEYDRMNPSLPIPLEMTIQSDQTSAETCKKKQEQYEKVPQKFLHPKQTEIMTERIEITTPAFS